MSLAARLSLLVIAILGASAAIAGIVFRSVVRRDIEARLAEQLEARMQWLQRGVGIDEGVLVFRPPPAPIGAAADWRIARAEDGRVLWRANEALHGTEVESREESARLEYRADGEEVVARERVPRAVVDAARADLPSFEVRRARRVVRGGRTFWRIDGEAHDLSYRMRLEEDAKGGIRSRELRLRTRQREDARASLEREDARAADATDPTLAALPELARGAAERLLGDATLERILGSTGDDGAVWELAASRNGRELRLRIDEAGVLLEKLSAPKSNPEPEPEPQPEAEPRTEPESAEWRWIRAADLPELVRESVVLEIGSLDVEAWLRRSGHRRVYEIETLVDDRAIALRILPSGAVARRSIRLDEDELPFPVQQAIESRLGGRPSIVRAESVIRSGIVEYRVELGDERMALAFRENGERVDSGPAGDRPGYVLPPGSGRVEVALRASVDATPARVELARISRLLVTIGPLGVALAGAMVALLVRWQLRPLARIADQSERVGPESLGLRIVDIGSSSECVRLGRAVNAMIERLETGVRRERRFAATAAHELYTPLAEMRAALEVTRRRERDVREYREALDELLHDVDRLERLVSGLLELSRSPEGRSRGRPVSLRRVARIAGVPRAALDALTTEDVLVEGDEELIASAIKNVLENADVHAGDRAPEVRVEIGDAYARILVTDRGPGVSPADRERIFEPFVRLDRSARDGGKGLGLGLALARSTARAFGGDLRLEDRADGEPGTRAVVQLRRFGGDAGGET